MFKTCRQFCFGIFLLFISQNLTGQNSPDWADSILNTLALDQSKDFALTHKYADTLFGIFQQRKAHCKGIKTLIYKSEFYKHNGDFKAALRNIYLANNLLQTHPCTEEPLQAEIYLSYATLYSYLNLQSKVNYYVQLGIQKWNPAWKNNEILIRLYLTKGDSYQDLHKQLYYFHLAKKLAEESKSDKMIEIVNSVIGTAYAINEQYKMAEIYIREALRYALKRNAYSTLSSIYNNLAGLSQSPKQTSIMVDSALYYATLSGNIDDRQTALQNKAFTFYNQNNFQSAYDQLWESFVLKDSIYNQEKVKSFAEMEQRFEAEKKNIEINVLQSENEIANLKASRNLGINFGLGGALLGIIFVALAFYQQNKKKQKLNSDLTIEKKKSDDLLLNILPEEIAEELKSSGKSEAKLYSQVSVLFTDFVNFTGISEQMGPTELVQEIHKNFTAFDTIMEKHGIEKIKTIGDAYLAVCGLPHETKDHAKKITLAALEIQSFMANNSGKFKIRIGIHSGAVVAGIVGVKKYAYDIWGDTVNTAARMEQYSEPGKINISGATYQQISQEFDCEYRGKINAKNKGEVDMYFVNHSLS